MCYENVAKLLLNSGANPRFKNNVKHIYLSLILILKNGESCAEIATGKCLNLFEDLKLVKVLVLGKENLAKTTLLKRIIREWKIRNRLSLYLVQILGFQLIELK
jgi:hypothetical protein